MKSLICQYFDTILPSSSLTILKQGSLFAASEFGEHSLYQFESLGDENEEVFTSSDGPQECLFNPRPFKNIVQTDTLHNFGTITDFICDDILEEGNPQIFAACGRGPYSSLKIIRYGLPVTQSGNFDLPFTPTGIWSLKDKFSDQFYKYLIIGN